MSYWKRDSFKAAITTPRGNGTVSERKKGTRINSLSRPLEDHWHLPESEKKKPTTWAATMSFRSLQNSLTRISKSKTFRTMLQGIRDPDEETAVRSLRESLLKDNQLPNKHDDYHTLLRFLRMRGFDQLKAKNMFVNMLQWREDNNVDAIEKEFKFEEYEAVKQCYPHGYHGVDKYGRPLYIERVGSMDLNSLLRITTIGRLVKYHISEQEKTLSLRYPACSLAAKKHIASTTAILDVKGLGTSNFSRPARELFTEIQKIDSSYYPETLNQLFIINAGPGFKALWKVISAFLEARTLEKIQVLGSSYQDKLAETVDLSNLPDFFGGNCNCYEYGGCLLKDKGPWTDPEIKTKLMDVFHNAQRSADEPSNKNIFEDLINSQLKISDRQLRSNSIRAPIPDIQITAEPDLGSIGSDQDMQTTSAAKRMAQKISELEAWHADTKEILQQLSSKQRELAVHIEQLKKLT